MVCFEHVGPARVWREDEQGFAASIGDLVALAIAADDRRKMQTQLLQAQKLESVGILAGGIAHDFNNLLTTILGGASSIMMNMQPQDPNLRSVKVVISASRQAAELPRHLLAYSGKGQFLPRPTNASATINETRALLETVVPKNVTLQMNLCSDLPSILIDIAQFQQVVMNVVINGAEAMGGTNGTVCITTGMQTIDQSAAVRLTTTRALKPGNYVYIQVEDTGCGMDAETCSKIFDPFFSTKFTGRGLGMAAVMGIVRSLEGAIQVDSKPGEGTTIQVLSPTSDTTPVPEKLFH